jgi:hypothetical protein
MHFIGSANPATNKQGRLKVENRTVTAQNILDTIEKMVQLVTSLRDISNEIEQYIRTIIAQSEEIERLRTLLKIDPRAPHEQDKIKG